VITGPRDKEFTETGFGLAVGPARYEALIKSQLSA